MNALAQKYECQGSASPGVSLDSRHPDVKNGTTALPKAHELPVRDSVNWMYQLDGQRAVNVRTAYGVEAIPANFPISRAGRIFALEHGDALEREVVRALGGVSGGLSK